MHCTTLVTTAFELVASFPRSLSVIARSPPSNITLDPYDYLIGGKQCDGSKGRAPQHPCTGLDNAHYGRAGRLVAFLGPRHLASLKFSDGGDERTLGPDYFGITSLRC